MAKWESDLNYNFSDEQWKTAICYSHSVTHCVNHWEMSQKIISQWYLTPYRLAKFSPENSSLCWRVCGIIYTLPLWDWKGLTSYSNKVLQLISQVTGVLTKPNPTLALLHLNIEYFPTQLCNISVIILVSAKTLITLEVYSIAQCV